MKFYTTGLEIPNISNRCKKTTSSPNFKKPYVTRNIWMQKLSLKPRFPIPKTNFLYPSTRIHTTEALKRSFPI